MFDGLELVLVEMWKDGTGGSEIVPSPLLRIET